MRKIRINIDGYNIKWVIIITIWTFFLAVGMSFSSEIVLKNVNIVTAFIILIMIIFIGIIFDLIGIAVASAREKPFHSMAANKIIGAKYAVKLVRNAGPVSNFCNDVIGDICGIVSGAAAAIIILQIRKLSNLNIPYLSVILSGLVAAITVGGKAIGKEIALKKSKEIVFRVGKILYYVYNKFGIDFLPKKRNVRINQKER
ncbi:hypothetical protein FQB35_07085 [Crassaminicella thermophila]|uniref:CNNM transmembrane domain-containing protein n=1 Tax=Crassaminicella thermophila TaxID=2599308 RepID=A0A5C0SEJ1_CRATE|nr:hypothetical protein [Crassaminicella thermophila]QEK12157.1 hypothetical protein FQB35_07085 [Crassaminicella thermophila]